MPKICKACLTTKPDDDFARRSYLCRPCAHKRKKARVQAWRAANKEHRRDYDQAYAAAHRPHILERKKRYHIRHRDKEHAYARTYRLVHRNELLAKMREWHAQNRESQLIYKHQYYRDHHEEILAKKRLYDLLHTEEIKHRGRLWYHRNKHRLQDNNRLRMRIYFKQHHEYCLKQIKIWRKNNPDIVRAYIKKYHALKKGASHGVNILHIDIAERDGWICHICHTKVTRETWSLDHLIPISKGGQHTPENVALAHMVCNARRGVGNYIPAQLRLFG